jgi:hypothetical protein
LGKRSQRDSDARDTGVSTSQDEEVKREEEAKEASADTLQQDHLMHEDEDDELIEESSSPSKRVRKENSF